MKPKGGPRHQRTEGTAPLTGPLYFGSKQLQKLFQDEGKREGLQKAQRMVKKGKPTGGKYKVETDGGKGKSGKKGVKRKADR